MPWRETPEQIARARAEVPVAFPTPLGTLFGIYTPADPAVPAAGRCAVFFTRPRSHRNRMWVEGARRLAAQGFSAFRFDYHGCGDSEGESTYLNPNAPYQADGLAALVMLNERFGEERFLVAGSCFDARTALSMFAGADDVVDGMVFYAAPVMELETLVKAHADHKDWRHLVRSLKNAENWKQLGDLQRWRYMATVLGRVAKRSVPLASGSGEPANDTPLADSFVSHFRALVRSKARALFIYGEADVELISFRIAQDTVFKRLSPEESARFEIELWPGDVHGFLNLPMQRRGLERAMDWFQQFHPAASAASAGSNGRHA